MLLTVLTAVLAINIFAAMGWAIVMFGSENKPGLPWKSLVYSGKEVELVAGDENHVDFHFKDGAKMRIMGKNLRMQHLSDN